jgi:hypothetical protein
VAEEIIRKRWGFSQPICIPLASAYGRLIYDVGRAAAFEPLLILLALRTELRLRKG